MINKKVGENFWRLWVGLWYSCSHDWGGVYFAITRQGIYIKYERVKKNLWKYIF